MLLAGTAPCQQRPMWLQAGASGTEQALRACWSLVAEGTAGR